ncbi:MAG: hypothetical protein M1812_000770 [Candelaria pacifica]|nr:MAG: hypothetical protein M1812_000770 [Candelaria pacifica]
MATTGTTTSTQFYPNDSLYELQPAGSNNETPEFITNHLQQNNQTKGRDQDNNETLPPPSAVVRSLARWNHPRGNMWRTFVTFLSFTVMGMNDAAYGALIPYLQTYYNLRYIVISLIFLSPLVGYVLAALTNNAIHMKFGQRGIAFIAPGAHLLAYILICIHPPYPVLVLAFMLAGFGNGVEDAAWNAWIGNMANANELLGFLHGFFGLGGTLSPLIATTMITKGHLPWYSFYYLMVGLATIELIASAAAFWNETGAKFRLENPRTTDKKGGRTKEAMSNKVTWICALFLLGYVGIEVALGGWIVEFMIKVRHGDPFASGMTSTGFWLGITIGRVILGFVTAKIGENIAIITYLLLALTFTLLTWLIPQFLLSALSIGFLGFVLGPLFPAAVIATTKLLPKHLHVSAIGFAAAFGGSGGAVFPFAVGALAQAKGVWVLLPFVEALLVGVLGLWCLLPKMDRERRVE